MISPRRKERLIALVVLATALFTPPLLLVADRAGGSPSWLPVYLFVAWGVVIGLMAWLMEGGRGE